MKKKILGVLLWTMIIFMELLPYGAVCVFATGPDTQIRELFSYFDLTPFGYANFGPLLTALLSVITVIFLAVYLLRGTHLVAVQNLSLAAFVTSFLPLFYGIKFFSPVGLLISLSLLTSYFWCRLMNKEL